MHIKTSYNKVKRLVTNNGELTFQTQEELDHQVIMDERKNKIKKGYKVYHIHYVRLHHL